jgi:hypothetical protein
MQLIATVNSQEIIVKSGTASRTGKPYSIREQHALVRLPNGEVRRMSFSLEADEQPMPNGEYSPKDSAVYAAKFGLEISMRARHWQRIEAKPAAKAA